MFWLVGWDWNFFSQSQGSSEVRTWLWNSLCVLVTQTPWGDSAAVFGVRPPPFRVLRWSSDWCSMSSERINKMNLNYDKLKRAIIWQLQKVLFFSLPGFRGCNGFMVGHLDWGGHRVFIRRIYGAYNNWRWQEQISRSCKRSIISILARSTVIHILMQLY